MQLTLHLNKDETPIKCNTDYKCVNYYFVRMYAIHSSFDVIAVMVVPRLVFKVIFKLTSSQLI